MVSGSFMVICFVSEVGYSLPKIIGSEYLKQKLFLAIIISLKHIQIEEKINTTDETRIFDKSKYFYQ